MTTEYYVKSSAAAVESARAAMNAQAKFLKPAVGNTYLRILPAVPAMQNQDTGEAPFFWHVSLHFGVGPQGRVVICPRKQTGGALSCPICTHAFALKDGGHEKAGNDMLPNWSAYMNVLVIDPKTGEPVKNKAGEIEVQVWSCGRGTLDKLFSKIERQEKKIKKSIDITDPDEGYVIELERKGTGRDDTKYEVYLADEPSSVADSVELWGPQLIDLTKLNTLMPASTLQQLLTGAEGPDPLAQKAIPAQASNGKRPTFSRSDDVVEGEYREADDIPFDTEENVPAASGDAAERLQKLVNASK